MLLAIPLGYFTAAFLLVSGVLNCIEFAGTIPDGMSRAAILREAATAGWPLLAATVILLLIQVCRQLEQLRLVATYTPGVRSSERKDTGRKSAIREEKRDEPPTTAPALAHLATPPAEQTRPHRYPNSPIPGSGRTTHQPAAEQQNKAAAPATPNRTRPDSQGLNFFKVD